MNKIVQFYLENNTEDSNSKFYIYKIVHEFWEFLFNV